MYALDYFSRWFMFWLRPLLCGGDINLPTELMVQPWATGVKFYLFRTDMAAWLCYDRLPAALLMRYFEPAR